MAGLESEINEGIERVLRFILGNVPSRRRLMRMADENISQIRVVGGERWVVSVVNHTVSHDLGYDDTPRTRSIVMSGRMIEYRLVTDWRMRRGIGLMQQLKDGPPLMTGFDDLSLRFRRV